MNYNELQKVGIGIDKADLKLWIEYQKQYFNVNHEHIEKGNANVYTVDYISFDTNTIYLRKGVK